MVHDWEEGEVNLQLDHTKEVLFYKTLILPQIKEEEAHTKANVTLWEGELQGEGDMDLHGHGELQVLIWSPILSVEPTREIKARYNTLIYLIS